MSKTLDPRLLQDGEVLGWFPLCQLLLMRDANYPWCVLVPMRENISEIYELNKTDQQQLCIESSTLAAFLSKTFNADKMNIAALGNVVAQLHVHHVVRYKNDPAWPAPIWGAHTARPYSETDWQQTRNRIITGLEQLDSGFTAA